MKHTIQALVENKFGVLARVASLFSARGYNIASLAVGETQDSTVSCMTIVVDASDERILEQIKKQLHKLIDVITVVDFTRREYIDRDLILVKVIKKKEAAVFEKLIKDYPVKIIESFGDCCIVEICADYSQEEEILKELKKIGIKELVRTGRIAIGS
ncbi:MAG: acetolactate synthase small subunit [Candidatus Omnitrophica bacterium]|nr:acetolactate synthase small subunit [Candidatus Omnitrophota bacterium]MBU0896177.1 acetolactate synthase small subunit [Candidatus Omnitrophota bacterium]MBU1133290.1 acetolactate synthase small subunit [Candidatus Omnitrophota bacterium]MBU1366822.1 acetolactate synthase small subunit [Candidatus Omnitrophota bacterium]MBU1523374.1 acetolactate synthase small subunit [Candidatus Omnitrophota bacterium]